LEIMPDHVHLFVNVSTSDTPHKVIKLIKGRSSRLLRAEFPHLLKLPSLWTHSYSEALCPALVMSHQKLLSDILRTRKGDGK